MVWVKLDDGLWKNPKIVALVETNPEALGLYVLALSWSGHEISDGKIPKVMIGRLLAIGGNPERTSEAANGLVESGLWHDDGDHFEIHDWAKYNPTRRQVQATRRSRAESGRKGGKQRASNRQANAKQTPSGDRETGYPVPVPDPVPVKRDPNLLGRTRSGLAVEGPPPAGSSFLDGPALGATEQSARRDPFERSFAPARERDDVRALFDDWRKLAKLPSAKLTDTRAELIRERIDSHGGASVRFALDAAREDPRCQGEIDGERHLRLEYLLGADGKLAKFEELAEAGRSRAEDRRRRPRKPKPTPTPSDAAAPLSGSQAAEALAKAKAAIGRSVP